MRKPSIAERLDDYARGRSAPFDWESANCCHLAAGWVKEIEGVDPMEGLKATPDEKSARRLIKTLGGDLVSAWTKQLRRGSIPPALAQTGDVVVTVTTGRQTAGICVGRHVQAISEDGKVVLLPMDAAIAAWRLNA